MKTLRLKKNEDRRLRAGHMWVYSNEIDTKISPLKSFTPGEEVVIEASDKTPLGIAYVNPHSLITGRLISRTTKITFDEDFVTDKLTAALQLRTRLYDKPYYRLFYGEGDGLPGLIIDRFGDHVVIQINTVGVDVKQDLIISTLKKILPEVKSILLRNDSSARIQEGLPTEVKKAFGSPPPVALLEENATQFKAPIWEGQKTGWFFDHRSNRLSLQKYVKNARVLDVFSYLGAWGIQAAKNGAKEVTCIDSSAFATDFIHQNAELNQVSSQVKILCGDAFETLKKLNDEKEKFDVIILDPPAFAKKQKDIKEGLIAYQRINELALKLLENNGILISCSCSMHISYEDLINSIRKATLKTSCIFQILERGHQAPDHPVHIAIPETDYLKMVIGRKI